MRYIAAVTPPEDIYFPIAVETLSPMMEVNSCVVESNINLYLDTNDWFRRSSFRSSICPRSFLRCKNDHDPVRTTRWFR